MPTFAKCVVSRLSIFWAATSPPALAKRFSDSKTQSGDWYFHVPTKSSWVSVEELLSNWPRRFPRVSPYHFARLLRRWHLRGGCRLKRLYCRSLCRKRWMWPCPRWAWLVKWTSSYNPLIYFLFCIANLGFIFGTAKCCTPFLDERPVFFYKQAEFLAKIIWRHYWLALRETGFSFVSCHTHIIIIWFRGISDKFRHSSVFFFGIPKESGTFAAWNTRWVVAALWKLLKNRYF